MVAHKATRNKKEFKNFEDQIEALDVFMKLTTVCLTLDNPRIGAEKENIYSVLSSLNVVFPEFFEELTTFNSLELHDKQEALLQKLKGMQLDIQNAINLLKGTISLNNVVPTSTDYGWWKSFLDDLVRGGVD